MENSLSLTPAPSCTQQQETEAPTDSTNVPPRSGGLSAGSGAPLLDIEGRNVPRENVYPVWRKKHFMTRRAVLDSLRLWQSEGYQCLWATLTSSPSSPRDRLRKDYQVLSKRIKRELGFVSFP